MSSRGSDRMQCWVYTTQYAPCHPHAMLIWNETTLARCLSQHTALDAAHYIVLKV